MGGVRGNTTLKGITRLDLFIEWVGLCLMIAGFHAMLFFIVYTLVYTAF